MSLAPHEEAAGLVARARDLYADDRQVCALIDGLERRLREPLRVALAGIVKAGKSTLLNAILGERIAPTDAGECTRVVTWYRYANSPFVTAYLHDGPPRRIPIRRANGELVLDLGAFSPDKVDRIEVGWPSRVLRSMILIDTPGIASLSQHISARSAEFLVPEDAPSSADAIIYLMRHLHPSDLGFLEAFRDTAAGRSQTVNAVAVLSRADEVGSGRIDSLLSASKVASRYEREGGLQSLALGVIPVAGLLAEGGRTLREDEFAAFQTLAAMERRERDRLLLSSDRFVQPNAAIGLSVQTRRRMVSRFGIFGIRLGTSLVRMGVTDASELAESLVQHSGLYDLERFVEAQFGARSTTLKVRAIIDGLEQVLKKHPRPDTDVIHAGIERLQTSGHELRELQLLSQARNGKLPMSDAEASDIVRIVGGRGTSAAARLGLPPDAELAQARERVAAELDRWRIRSMSPLTDRAALDVCRIVIRSLSEVASRLGQGGDDRSAPDVVLPGGPLDGGPEGADDKGHQREATLDEQ